MTRLESNIKILNIVEQLVHEFPDMRFIQLLMVVDAVIDTDQFNEESEVTLNRIKEKIEYQQRRYDKLADIDIS
ncbi:MAG: hypothetical protein MR695_01555 [Solobacterium sp.]|nr:hypothetical protein [Solobacterium sp.]